MIRLQAGKITRRVHRRHKLQKHIIPNTLDCLVFVLQFTMSRVGQLVPLATAWSQPTSCYVPAPSDYPGCLSGKHRTATLGATCTTAAYAICEEISSNAGPLLAPRTCHYSEILIPRDDIACWPPISTHPLETGAITLSPYMGSFGFYSPGLQCPQGYYSACSATHEGSYN